MKELGQNKDYKKWLVELKERLRSVQLKAAVTVNSTLLQFYWELGADIVIKQENSPWGSGFLKQLSSDLRVEFPEMRGFSERNLKYIRRWYLFYNKHFIKGQQAVALLGIGKKPVSQFIQIPWGHNIVIVEKCKTVTEALFYVNRTVEHNWSRSVLVHQIERDLWHREGKAVTNFSQVLPTPQSDLAQQILKDPYVFDFMSLSSEYNERDLEEGLVTHITNFLLELGAGFAYMGRQYQLQVGARAFFLDLLFYHTQLHCYVVIELKVVEFEPEHVGKLNFYLKAIDEQMNNAPLATKAYLFFHISRAVLRRSCCCSTAIFRS